jgi:predicted helicase
MSQENLYLKGFSLNDIFLVSSTGIETKCDNISIQIEELSIKKVLEDFLKNDSAELAKKYERTDSAGWSFDKAKNDLLTNKTFVTRIAYRPFDERFTIYTGYSSGFMGRPRSETMNHLLKDNLAISSTRSKRSEHSNYFITRSITDKSIASSLDNNYIFPLYLYSETKDQLVFGNSIRKPNFSEIIINDFKQRLGLDFTIEKETLTGSATSCAKTFAPIDILDYIYAVLHSPKYRETYKEFLKIDFPRVPDPTDQAKFWELVRLGGELRQLHLLESEVVDKRITTYPEDGNNVVDKPRFELADGATTGRVWINGEQYFDGVPGVAWAFYIGGYQPAQKWLKDRKGRELSFDDILHYQKIIVALTETDRLMKEVDVVGVV